ncbi:hypothetical protein [Nitrospira sp. Nam74]
MAESWIGIILAIGSLTLLPWLAASKRRVAECLGSAALEAETRQTQIALYLSGTLLIGLVLNATLGWWWADPVAALSMVPVMLQEGCRALLAPGFLLQRIR